MQQYYSRITSYIHLIVNPSSHCNSFGNPVLFTHGTYYWYIPMVYNIYHRYIPLKIRNL
jgi:hypothetical protein